MGAGRGRAVFDHPRHVGFLGDAGEGDLVEAAAVAAAVVVADVDGDGGPGRSRGRGEGRGAKGGTAIAVAILRVQNPVRLTWC